MTFSLYQGGVVMSIQIMHSQSSNILPLAHTRGTFALIWVAAPFLMFIQTASYNGIPLFSRW